METESSTDSVNPLSDSFYAMYGMTIDNGYTLDNGYTQDNGYPHDNGYRQDNEYTHDNGYTQDNGYPHDNGYTHDNDYTQDNGYPRDKGYTHDNGYNMRNDYTLDSGYKKYNRYNKVNGYGYTQENGCIKEDGYTQNKGYNKDNGFTKDNGYIQKNGRHKDDGYTQNSDLNKDNDFTKDNGYTQDNSGNTNDGYTQENSCNKDDGYTQNSDFNKDNGYTQENGGNNEDGYTQNSDFNKDKGFTTDNCYTQENGGNKDNGYTQEKPHRRNRQRSLENNNVISIVIYDDPGVKYPDEKEWPASTWKLGHILSSVFVRALLISHNILTVWRVTEDFNNDIFWFIIAANFLLFTEGLVVIWKRGGVEYSWWCPCFLMYLASTIPAIWLLQLNQYNALVSEGERVILFHSSPNVTEGLEDSTSAPLTLTTSPSYVTTTAHVAQNLVTVLFMSDTTGSINDNNIALSNFTNDTTLLLANVTSSTSNISGLFNTTMSPVYSSTIKELTADSTIDSTITSETWIIIVEEALVYLLVLCRWLLPRGEVSREFLADLLLEFLAIASDIMELLAVFDEEEVRSNLTVTLWIMAVWSASFIQFIPILMNRRRLRSFRNSPEIPCIVNNCGNKFVEIVVTCMSIFLQDGPFLVLRMYIIIKLRLVTYSLVFFVLKNIVTLLLYFYRLMIMCYRIRVCRRKKNEKQNFENE